MAAGSDQVFFHKGLTYDVRSALQQPGFLRRAENISFETEGEQTIRARFIGMNTAAFGPVHSIKTWRTSLFAADGTNVRGRTDTGDFTVLHASFTDAVWQFKAYKDFLMMTNGADFALADAALNLYPAQVANPATAPSGAAGAVGGPNGTYRLYVSYFITWPNGHTYETGLSPASADVTVAEQRIEWSNIPVCPYAKYHGTDATIYRNLYRGPGAGGSLTEVYYVGTVDNNTATTYSDDNSDGSLETSYVCPVTGYLPPRTPRYIEWNYGRLFMVDAEFPNRLYYTQPAGGNTGIANEIAFPLAIRWTNWDDVRVPGIDAVDPQGLVAWGSYLYIPLKHTWIRKQGNEPSTWAFRKTYALNGIGAPWTVAAGQTGIIGVTSPKYDECGIAVFNGQTSEIFTSPKLDWIFKNDMNLDRIDRCRGAAAGKYYFLLYPSAGVSEPDRFLAVDMRRFPDIRVAQWTDLYGRSIDADTQSTRFYIGGSDGTVRQRTSIGTLSVAVETHDLIGGDAKLANEIKAYKEIRYALDSGGHDATLEVYIDDVKMTWPDGASSATISGTGQTTKVIRNIPADWQGYRIRLALTGANVDTFTIYSPWTIDYEAKV